ncbi:hypothetical protein EZ449_15845 [Pedobacter frigidisoli]|uniref:YCII-related domain-containing protein n=1 Tax=Pedobacter frigidisoli TaxID=2530455 RepID=A0A4R0NZ27_9SPHI|nr:YciI family protein [Pedobacter frigidisoli]TCD05928.1 hypothetical protein EZ449_15845 [Pedobacter frigidisoli]
MKYFIATYTHPNEEGWKDYLTAHIKYLEQLVEDEKLVASGPLLNTPVKSAMLIIKVENVEEAQYIVAQDPFTIQGLVGESTLLEWDPFFGKYQTFKHKMLLTLQKLFRG